jgi:hypothetical protein
MKNIQTIIKYGIWAVIFASFSYAIATSQPWNEPECAPPGCNAPEPINASSTTQTKEGILWTGGFGSNAGGYFATTLGVATSTDPSSKSLKALFGGNIGATEYCDEYGNNCLDTEKTYESNYVLKRSLSSYTGDSIAWCPSTNPYIIYCQTIDDQAPSAVNGVPPVMTTCLSDGVCSTLSGSNARNQLGGEDFYHEVVTKSSGGVIIQGCLNYDKGHAHDAHKIDIICSK